MLDVDRATPVDVLEQRLLAREALIGRLRLEQAELIRELDQAQVAQVDGSRSMLEWVMARCDVTEATARDLIAVAKATGDFPEVTDTAVQDGGSFDRTVGLVKLAQTGASIDVLDESQGHDLNGVARLAARRRRITRSDEASAFRDQYVALQSTLDDTAGRFWGSLEGADYQVFTAALDQRADEFRTLPGPHRSRGQRYASALVAISHDALHGPIGDGDVASGTPVITAFVDLDVADDTQGELGAELTYGPRIGPAALERIWCEGRVRIVGLHDGAPVVTSAAAHTIPPAIRAFVARRDGGCVIDGCRSRYRLQPHHVRHRADHGDDDPDNLATLCWYHHHIVIHGLGYHLDPDSPPHRRRFVMPARPRSPDPP